MQSKIYKQQLEQRRQQQLDAETYKAHPQTLTSLQNQFRQIIDHIIDKSLQTQH